MKTCINCKNNPENKVKCDKDEFIMCCNKMADCIISGNRGEWQPITKKNDNKKLK